MVNIYYTEIEALSIHKIGNKNKGENLELSESPYNINHETTDSLKSYFLDPFKKKENLYYFYEFVHQTDLDFNEIYNSCCEIFNNIDTFHLNSIRIAKHLYDQSNHQHIKNGELYITYLSNCYLNNEKTDAIGIFKSELKSEFMLVENNFSLTIKEGINLNKLDKGCIILNTEKETGFKIINVDSNKYDTRYWTENFLNIDFKQDKNLLTKNYLDICKKFSQDVIFPNTDKVEQSMFMNNSIDYFSRNEEFNQNDFINKILPDPVYQSEFKDFVNTSSEKKGYKIEDLYNFPISDNIVQQQRKKFKNLIKLDTDIEIKINGNSNSTINEFLEKGYDEEKGMYYYLAYYNKEKN